jgi:hypothetical protein
MTAVGFKSVKPRPVTVYFVLIIITISIILINTNLGNATVICVDKYNHTKVIACSARNAIYRSTQRANMTANNTTNLFIGLGASLATLFTGGALSGLGASLGGALAGGFFGSYLQVFYSSKSDRTKNHLSDLKEKVIIPLIDIVSNFNFTLSDFKFSGFSYQVCDELQSTDIPFQDFMTNHYPTINSKLYEVITLSAAMNNKKHLLLNQLKTNLSNTFIHDLKPTEFRKVNQGSVDTLVQAILNEYDRSYLRITDYLKYRYLYFYPVEDSQIAFSDPKYEIFSSVSDNEETNIGTVNDVRSTLLEAIDKIINQLANELKDYNESKLYFTKARKELLDRLFELKYGSKLNFEKKLMRKKCSLV